MRFAYLLFALFFLCNPAHAAGDTPAPVKYETLRFGKVRLHTGPGQQYPVAWEYQRKGLPVEVLAEYDKWKKISDPDGTIGWMQDTMLSDKRGLIVTGADQQTLRQQPDANAPAAAYLQPGVIGKLIACQKDWCNVKGDGFEGWLMKTAFWGATAMEVFEK